PGAGGRGAEPGFSNHNSVPPATRFVAPALRQTASVRKRGIDANCRRFRSLGGRPKLDSAGRACTGDGAIGVDAAIRPIRRAPMGRSRNATMGHFRVPALALAALVALAGTAAAQGVVKSVHGDWQIRCDMPPGAQTEQCALIQSVTAEDRPNVGLTVIVLKT